MVSGRSRLAGVCFCCFLRIDAVARMIFTAIQLLTFFHVEGTGGM